MLSDIVTSLEFCDLYVNIQNWVLINQNLMFNSKLLGKEIPKLRYVIAPVVTKMSAFSLSYSHDFRVSNFVLFF